MRDYKVDRIRNIALLGHGGTGKTTLTEAVLHSLGLTSRMGNVDDGNTVSDFDKEEIARKFSMRTSIIPVEWNDSKYNLLDTPGYFDYVTDVNGALRVCGGAVIMVDATAGVQVGTEKDWRYMDERGKPRILFINKMDKDNIDYMKLIDELKEKFGKKVAPFVVPMGDGENFKGFVNVVDMKGRIFDGKTCTDQPIPDEYKEMISKVRDSLIEAVAETSEELMEKYFEGEEFTMEEIHTGLRNGVINGEVVPVLVGSAAKKIGIETLLEVIFDYMPTPKDMFEGEYWGMHPDSEEKVIRHIDEQEPFSALVFKTIVDPFVGKISLFKVYSGSLKKDMEVLNPNKDKMERIGSVFLMRGKEQLECSRVVAGDIGATAKLNYTETGDTLCDKSKPVKYKGIKVPEACLYMAIEPKAKGDEEKIGTALHKLLEEDPSLKIERNRETKQLLVGGQGNMQLMVVTNKLKNDFKVDVELVDQKIAYRETIKGTSTVQGRYKKQSGGAGQFGDVHIKFERSEENFEFEEKIFGGSVPRQYIPAVEKGLLDCLDKGVLAGYPVVNLKATLLDGSYHAVDSSEMAFKMAASMAFKKGLAEAKPVMLEPVMHVEIIIPEDYMGDIMGDMNKRRGRILGMEPNEGGFQKVVAEAPLAEMFKYATDLRSMTQARGEFVMNFERYDEMPSNLAEKVIEQSKEED